KMDKIKKGSKIVAVLTGHGLKDPDTAISVIPKVNPVEPEMGTILKIIGL
ncbi:MAG: threonine synthase, partial [Thermotogota bacterium]|nr:threonine synthase [Thermotogota bacterium]